MFGFQIINDKIRCKSCHKVVERGVMNLANHREKCEGRTKYSKEFDGLSFTETMKKLGGSDV